MAIRPIAIGSAAAADRCHIVASGADLCGRTGTMRIMTAATLHGGISMRPTNLRDIMTTNRRMTIDGHRLMLPGMPISCQTMTVYSHRTHSYTVKLVCMPLPTEKVLMLLWPVLRQHLTQTLYLRLSWQRYVSLPALLCLCHCNCPEREGIK